METRMTEAEPCGAEANVRMTEAEPCGAEAEVCRTDSGTRGEQEPDFAAYLKDMLNLQDVNPSLYSPLALAYLGDAVYELIIRTKVMNHGSMQVNNMHKKSAQLVNAGTQAQLVRTLLAELSGEELTIYKRGRNAKSATAAKHATIIDYRTATGFEALCGYLYLTGRLRRLIELISHGLKGIGELE